MILEITPDIEAIVRDILLTGNYAGEHEILYETLALPGNRERLRREVQIGLAEFDRGERVDEDEVYRLLRACRTGN